MAATGDGSGHYLATSALGSTPSSYSYAFWYYTDHAPGGSIDTQPFSMKQAASFDYDSTFVWDFVADPTVRKGATHRNANGSYSRAQIASSPAGSEWKHIAVTFDGSSLKMYFKGSLEATTAATPSPGTTPYITVLAWDGGAASFDPGRVGECCVWNTALTAAEVMSIAEGTAVANTVQGSSVIFYAPINADGDTVTGPTLTNHSCTFATTYFNGTANGGVAIGSGTTSTTHYTWTPDGGVAIGSGTLATTVYHVTMDGGVAIGSGTTANTVYHIAMEGGVAIGSGTTVPTAYNIHMDGGVAIGADPRVKQTVLGNAVVIGVVVDATTSR